MYSNYPSPLKSTPGLHSYIDLGLSTDKATMVRPPSPYPMTTSPVASTIPQENRSTNTKQMQLYKTEYCRNWSELGECRYGKKCRYAHGDAELRKVARHSRYKTQICRMYHTEGTCLYGNRCTFIHDHDGVAAFTIDGNKLVVGSTSLVDGGGSLGGEISQKTKNGLAVDVNGSNVRQHSRFFSTKNINKDHQVPLDLPFSPHSPAATTAAAVETVKMQNNGVWNSKLGLGSPQPLAHTTNLVGQQGLTTSPTLTTTPTNEDDRPTPIFQTTYDLSLCTPPPPPRSYSLPTSSASMNRYSYPTNMYAAPHPHSCYNQKHPPHLHATTTLDTGVTDHLDSLAIGGGHRRGSYSSYLSASSSSKPTSLFII